MLSTVIQYSISSMRALKGTVYTPAEWKIHCISLVGKVTSHAASADELGLNGCLLYIDSLHQELHLSAAFPSFFDGIQGSGRLGLVNNHTLA